MQFANFGIERVGVGVVACHRRLGEEGAGVHGGFQGGVGVSESLRLESVGVQLAERACFDGHITCLSDEVKVAFFLGEPFCKDGGSLGFLRRGLVGAKSYACLCCILCAV